MPQTLAREMPLTPLRKQSLNAVGLLSYPERSHPNRAL
jgi:hypothetical protein